MSHWRTTLTGIGKAAVAVLTALAGLPYELGEVAIIIPPEWKAIVVKAGLAALFILRIIEAFITADAKNKENK